MNSKLFSLVCGLCLALQAQEFRGTVSGVVTDSTGSSVAMQRLW